MVYLDTSFIAPLVLPEPASAAIERYLEQHADAALVISHWGCVEFNSLVARRVRMKILSHEAARIVLEEFDRLVAESCRVLASTSEDYRLAREFLARFDTRLRAGDALHLAIAAHAPVTRLLTLDAGMLTAARVLNIPASAGPRR